MKINLLVCYHKQAPIVVKDKNYLPIQVGKNLSKIQLDMMGDNTGRNISSLNPYFCELTAQYWAWKNLKNIDIIGLCHYRRYFKFSGGTDSIYLQKEISIQDVDTKSISTILDKYDVILPKPTIDRASVYDNFSRFMTEEQLQIYLRIFLSKHPEYESVLTNYMQNNKCVHFNMFIMRWDLFCQYNEFLFEILFEAKKVIKDFPYSFYNRSVGMFSEILLPIFCEFNKLKIKHLPIIFFCEENNQQKFYSKILPKWIKLKIKSIVNNFIFIVNRKKTDSIINHFWDMYLKNDGINIS